MEQHVDGGIYSPYIFATGRGIVVGDLESDYQGSESRSTSGYLKVEQVKAYYTVKHIYKGLPGEEDEVVTTTGIDVIGASITPEVTPKTGFRDPSEETIVVKADGTSAVEYIYTRKAYLVSLYLGEGIKSVERSRKVLIWTRGEDIGGADGRHAATCL